MNRAKNKEGLRFMEQILISVFAGFILIAACYFGRRIEQDSLEPQEIDSRAYPASRFYIHPYGSGASVRWGSFLMLLAV